jgi:hypothetical protein
MQLRFNEPIKRPALELPRGLSKPSRMARLVASVLFSPLLIGAAIAYGSSDIADGDPKFSLQLASGRGRTTATTGRTSECLPVH